MKRIGAWWVPSGDTHLEEYLKAHEGEYQPAHRQASLKVCARRRVALDIGAHIGLWSRRLASEFEEVLAFEPVAQFRECFVRNVTAENVTLYPFALGREPGRVKILIDERNSGASHVAECGSEDVETRALDSLELADVDYIKVDVEGFELFVLEGARETLARCRPVVILEQKRHGAAHFGVEQHAALKYLQSLGAEVRRQVLDDWIVAWPP